MGIFDFLKNENSIKDYPPKSKYEKLPLINPQEDKMSPKGYIERKFFDSEYVHGKMRNIFRGSNIPIVKELDYINNDLETTVLQEKFGRKVRITNEYFYYSIPENLQSDFLNLIALLNSEIVKHKLPNQYTINLNSISFEKTEYYQIPWSVIKYYPEKNDFEFYFTDLKKKKIKSSIKPYEEYNTEYGYILYKEDGSIKKAQYKKIIKGETAKITFKMYKTGFELYEITYIGKVIYKRT